MTFLCEVVLSHRAAWRLLYFRGRRPGRARERTGGGEAGRPLQRLTCPSRGGHCCRLDKHPTSQTTRQGVRRADGTPCGHLPRAPPEINCVSASQLMLFFIAIFGASDLSARIPRFRIYIYGQVANCALNPRKVGLGAAFGAEMAPGRVCSRRSIAVAAFPVLMAMSCCCCCISLPPPTACTAQILDIIFALNRREIGLSLKVNESSAQGPNMN
jgi:hypothetical protein